MTMTDAQRQELLRTLDGLRGDLLKVQNALKRNDSLTEYQARSYANSAQHRWRKLTQLLQA